jgi:hypothetical protein
MGAALVASGVAAIVAGRSAGQWSSGHLHAGRLGSPRRDTSPAGERASARKGGAMLILVGACMLVVAVRG